MRLESAREASLEEYRSSEQMVSSNFRAIERSRFEELHPVKIEADGLKVVTKKIEGQNREVVLVRKLPEGEWDLSLRERTGVREREVLDTNELQITPGQLKNKFEGKRKKLHAQVVEKGNAASVLDSVVNQKSKKQAEDDEMAQLSSSDEEPGLGSLLEQEMPEPAPKRAAAAKAGAAAKVAPAAKASSAASKTQQGLRSNTKQIQPQPQPQREAPEEMGADDEKKSRGRPSKFQGKNGADVLEQHGLTQIKDSLEKA